MCVQPADGQPQKEVGSDSQAGTRRKKTYHQARRPPRALDAFEANVSRGAL